MATALVSGAAVLVWTLQPAATGQQIADILENAADKVGTNPQTGEPIPYVNGRNDYFGYGRLNVGEAIRRAYPPSLVPVTEAQHFLLGGPVTQQTRLLALANPSAERILWRATVLPGAEWLSVVPTSGISEYGTPGTLMLRVSSAGLGLGWHFGAVRVEPQAGGPNFSSFDIQVQLQVSSSLSRSFVPWLLKDGTADGWLDPLDGSDPNPLALGLENNSVRQLRLPFPVMFYGAFQTRIGISDNGLVIFGQPATVQMYPPTGCLQTAAAPNNAIYALALDWRPDFGGQQVYVHQPDTDTYVVTWSQMRRAGNPVPQSFQLVFRRSGSITANYRSIETLSPGIVGAENWDGTVAQQILCGGIGRGVGSGDSVAFKPGLPW